MAITFAKPACWAQAHAIRSQMNPPTWAGIARGVYEITLKIEGAKTVEIGLEDAAMIRQVGRIFQRVVDENTGVMQFHANSEENETLLNEAASSFRYMRWHPGSDALVFIRDLPSKTEISDWEVQLLIRYEELLGRIYHANQELIDKGMTNVASR